jgi:hypothetical protein
MAFARLIVATTLSGTRPQDVFVGMGFMGVEGVATSR